MLWNYIFTLFWTKEKFEDNKEVMENRKSKNRIGNNNRTKG